MVVPWLSHARFLLFSQDEGMQGRAIARSREVRKEVERVPAGGSGDFGVERGVRGDNDTVITQEMWMASRGDAWST
jgi:hypothetical protein